MNIPLPQVNSSLGGLFGLNFVKTEVKIDLQLLKILCTYNLTNKVSYNSLKELAMGYSIQRNVTTNRVIENLLIEY